jgi:hypothetical protein
MANNALPKNSKRHSTFRGELYGRRYTRMRAILLRF